MEKSNEPQQRQIIFNFLEYLQELKKTFTEEEQESVDVAFQCLSSTFKLDVNNETQKRELSFSPQTLPSIVNFGLSGKKKLEEALAKMVNKDY
jgi:hypothetical protein